MDMNISEYWDERTVFIYGLLAGYTQQKPEQITEAVNRFVNDSKNLVHAVRVMKALEVDRLVYFNDVTIHLWGYRNQINEELEDDDASTLLATIEKNLPYESQDKELDLVNITDLASKDGLVTSSLHGQLSFGIYVQDRLSLQARFADYLNRFKHGELFSPLNGYAPYREQEKDVLNWINSHKEGDKLLGIALSETTRLLETIFTQVTEGKLAIKNFAPESDATSPFFGIVLAKAVSHSGVNGFGSATQRIDINRLKVTPSSYSHQSGVLNLAGVLVAITKQKQRQKETKEATLMRLLFSVKYFYDGLPIEKIYKKPSVSNPRTKANWHKKAKSLKTAINNKLPEELKDDKLIKVDETRFFIAPSYKK